MSYGAVQFASQVAKHKYSHTKKKKTDDATMQKNAKILEKGLVQTKSFFSKECEEVLWRFSQKLVVALRESIMARPLA